MKNIVLIILFLFHLNVLRGEWDARQFARDNHIQDIRVLDADSFRNREMDLFEYLKGSWCTQEKAKMILELTALIQPDISVEIGAYSGSTAAPLLKGLKYLKRGHAFIVDAWSPFVCIKNLDPEDHHTRWWSSVNMKKVKNEFNRMIQYWKFQNYCTVLQMTSEEAALHIPSEIDFLHLDGNFSEEGALFDAMTYLPKVKKGGYILISNVSMKINEAQTKLKATFYLLDHCDAVAEIEEGNVLLLKKRA